MILDERLKQKETLLLDGAIGSEIARLGGAMDSAAWCALANKNHPDVVQQVHEEYIRAGASVVTANTFATCRHVLAGAGLADEAPSITARAVELARQAVDAVAPDRPMIVAGSMSNTRSWIPGTFSPDPEFLPTPEQESADYREMANALADAGADVIILEMMLRVESASRLAEAASATGLPVWAGISCSLLPDGSVAAWDMHLEERPDKISSTHTQRETQPIELIIDAMKSFNPQVMGIMHSDVNSTGPGLAALAQKWSGPTMAYPESTHIHAVEPAKFAEHCLDWVDNGVQIIGGCCGTTIEHIRALAEALEMNR
ncbi:MAG: homocysteine S-methyltransferase family protein [Pseudomonadota bacterium]